MIDQFLLDQYILNHTSPEDECLQELERETNLTCIAPRMLSGRLQGQILQMLSCMIRPRAILEIGTFTGYSAICLAKGLSEGGVLHTIEIDDELEAIARKYFIKSGLIRQITSHYGDAKMIIPTFNQSFDLVFIDADKREYSDYYRLAIDLVPIGGIIIADNILWNGKVVDPDSNSDAQTRNIIEFNDLVHNDDRIRNVILPIRDGMMILQKIR